MITHARTSFYELDLLSIWVDLVNAVDNDLFDSMTYRMAFDMIEPIITSGSDPDTYSSYDSNVFFKLYIMINELLSMSLFYEYSCKKMLAKAHDYEAILNEFLAYSKTIVINIPTEVGGRYFDKKTIVSRISKDASVMTMLASVYEKFLSGVTDEEDEALSEYWFTNNDALMQHILLIMKGVEEYKEGLDQLMGKKCKASGQQKIETFLKIFTQTENTDGSESD
jgi:hypothetical protein